MLILVTVMARRRTRNHGVCVEPFKRQEMSVELPYVKPTMEQVKVAWFEAHGNYWELHRFCWWAEFGRHHFPQTV